MTAYKSKIINLKLDKDQIQCRIYFLTFIESLEMIFSQYKETCGVLLDYPKIVKKSIRNILHVNIDVHCERFIAELPGDGVKCI